MQLTIRKILPEDVPVLAAMAKATFFDTFNGTCSDTDMQQFLVDHFAEHVLAKEVANPAYHYFFAEADGIPAGYLMFGEENYSFPEVNKWKAIELKRIYVLKEWHGKGVAQALMEYFLGYAAAHAYEAVWLGVWEHNLRAQKFYEKYGFEKSGYTHDFPIGDTPQTDCWFWKFL